jgi:FkbM family methyltransferase
LGDSGRFLDVGAYDGKTFSNTLKLYERGWSGVLVEPSPCVFKSLSKQYEGSTRVKLVQKAVGNKMGAIDFYDCGGDAISSTSLEHKKKWEAGYKCKYDKITVQSITWKALLDEVGYDFGFVNIDTEGTNLSLLMDFPFNKCLPMVLCVEHDGNGKGMQAHLNRWKYRNVYQSGENIVFYRGH